MFEEITTKLLEKDEKEVNSFLRMVEESERRNELYRAIIKIIEESQEEEDCKEDTSALLHIARTYTWLKEKGFSDKDAEECVLYIAGDL